MYIGYQIVGTRQLKSYLLFNLFFNWYLKFCCAIFFICAIFALVYYYINTRPYLYGPTKSVGSIRVLVFDRFGFYDAITTTRPSCRPTDLPHHRPSNPPIHPLPPNRSIEPLNRRTSGRLALSAGPAI